MRNDDIRDPFSSSDVEVTLHSSVNKWTPQTEYAEVSIATLNTGPHCVCLTGRIVNLYNQPTTSKMPQAASGCAKMIVKDDTGAITVARSVIISVPEC